LSQILETERLTLREFTAEDDDFIIKLLNSPGWTKYIGKSKVQTSDDAKKHLLNGPIKSYKTNGFGLSLVTLKSNNASIGMCGLIKRETLEYIDIGFAFLPEYTCFGYAFEIASATLDYAKHTLNLKKIVAITSTDNISSVKLLEKIGLKFEKNIRLKDDIEEVLLFGIEMN